MIDILLMNDIFSAISKKTKIIFIGDHNQLKPIKSASILKYIFSYAKDGYSFKIKSILEEITKTIITNNEVNKKIQLI